MDIPFSRAMWGFCGWAVALLAAALWPAVCHAAEAKVIERTADATLKVAEMNRGDTLRFRLANGQVRSFVLEETRAAIVERLRGGIIYAYECRLLADGQPLTLRRFTCSQETFYEPWVINGVRLWFSSSAAIFKLVPIRYPQDHYKLDAFDAVFAFQDATLPICPQPMRPWFPLEQQFIDVGHCYNGDDPWLGPYLGQACHVGLDINMPKGTPLYAPIDFDDNWIFSADHRWRGVRRWTNRDVWALQSHHVDKLLIRQNEAVSAGAHYAEAAGKGVGSHPHSHFEFRFGEDALNRGPLAGIELDPWILFWQIFQTDRRAREMIHAEIDPISPATTGQPARFTARSARAGKNGGPLRYFWTFGDGGFSADSSPEHIFSRPGVFPVSLVVDDGQARATSTHHVTVGGEPIDQPVLVLQSADEVTFRPRPPYAADVYGWPVKSIAHTLRFAARRGGGRCASRTVALTNAGTRALADAAKASVKYAGQKEGWVHLVQVGTANAQRLEVSVDPAGLPPGRHEAAVTVTCAGALNGVQTMQVELHVRERRLTNEVVVDDRDEGFYATPFAWVGHQFLRVPKRGYMKRYLTNGGLPSKDAVARFTPDLAEGRYEVMFHPDTPFVQGRFPVRIRHARGEQKIEFTPDANGLHGLGVYEFNEGTGGFVEVSGEGAEGNVVVDAVIFRRVAAEKSRPN